MRLDCERAALDRHIVGLDARRARRVLATCPRGHKWFAIEFTDMGATELDVPECPVCGEDALDDVEDAPDESEADE